MGFNSAGIDPERWYNTEEASEFLGIKEATIRKHINDKKIKATKHRVTKRWMIKGSELIKFQNP